MAQLTLYIDDETAKQLDEAAAKDGLSRSAWVRHVLHEKLHRKWPEEWLATLGSWEDDRSVEEILADIRNEVPQRKRESFD